MVASAIGSVVTGESMTDHDGHERREDNAPGRDAELMVLTHALEKLRARDGVSLAHLQAAGANGTAVALLNLAAVRRYSTVHELDPPRAAVAVVAETVRDSLTGSYRLVADAILGLGIFARQYERAGVERRIIDGLRSNRLNRRRETLLSHWKHLHEAMAIGSEAVPSDRTLRGSMESLVLEELAHQLRRRELHSFGSGNAPPREHPAESGTSPGRLIVIGGAVMDATFHTKVLPQVGTSNEAHRFELSPGGKGLTQAVAAARLGLRVSLVAAVADDHFGHEIIRYLQHEHVDTSLLKVVREARTPFTGVIAFELGDSVAVNWRNDRDLRLDVRDLDQVATEILASDALLLTFEIPRETAQHALSLAHSAADRPMVIVTPGQPYADGGVTGQALSQIDYLVAHAWELGRYGPPGQPAFDLDAVARRMLAYGVETLCVPTAGGCNIYSERWGTFTTPTFPSQYKESSAARDAFCAALAAMLIGAGGDFTDEVALWATAAMAAASADYPLPNSMPDRTRVEQFRSRSRFTVTPVRVAPIGADDVGIPEESIPSPR